jgi:hypothetical protein
VRRALPRAGDRHRALGNGDLDVLRVDAGQLDDDRDGVGALGAEAVHVRPEAMAATDEPWHLPEVGEELVELLLDPIGVSALHVSQKGTPGGVVHTSPLGRGRSQAVAARASLILSDGSERQLEPEFTVGRAEDNDLLLEKPTVSRHHVVVSAEGDRWFVEDKGSFNGTFVNGSRIQAGSKVPLRHGDRIGLGAESVVFFRARVDDRSRGDDRAPDGPPALTRPLSPFQRQVVEALCSGWLAGGSLDELPTNEEIAARLGTPGATETVKAALRRAYAKAGLTEGSPYAKRRALCKIARQRGWV